MSDPTQEPTLHATIGPVNGCGDPHPGNILGAYRTLLIRLDPPLSTAALDTWLDEQFAMNGAAGLWGNVLRLGPQKAHVYGLELGTWHRLDMEFTPAAFLLVAPREGDAILPVVAQRIVDTLATA